jgi:membrane associated rhomboid family serine protease
VIPLRDVIPSGTRPYATLGLITAHIAASLLEAPLPFAGGGGLSGNAGARALIALFSHADWLHLAGTLLYVWIFGENVEAAVGRGRFVLLYLLCGVIASAAFAALSTGSPALGVGASGAVTGLIGAYLLLYPRSRILVLTPFLSLTHLTEVPATLFLGIWFVLQLLPAFEAGPLSRTAPAGVVLAHLAALLAGAIAIRLFRKRQRWG